MAWVYLILAGLSEVVWAYGLKASNSFTHIKWSVITLIFIFISFYLFVLSMKRIPIGIAYAVFTGIGTAGTAFISVLFLGEDINLIKIISLTLLILGIAGLKLVKDDV